MQYFGSPFLSPFQYILRIIVRYLSFSLRTTCMVSAQGAQDRFNHGGNLRGLRQVNVIHIIAVGSVGFARRVGIVVLAGHVFTSFIGHTVVLNRKYAA